MHDFNLTKIYIEKKTHTKIKAANYWVVGYEVIKNFMFNFSAKLYLKKKKAIKVRKEREQERGREEERGSEMLTFKQPQEILLGAAVWVTLLSGAFPPGLTLGCLCSCLHLALTADGLPLHWTHMSLSLSVPLHFHSPLWLVAPKPSWQPPH